MILAFAEEICWKGNMRQFSGKEVVFRAVSVGKIHGIRVDTEFRASWDLWYDPDDEALLAALYEAERRVDWDFFVFYKQPTNFSIQIYDPDKDKIVGSISVRRRVGGDPSGEIDQTNVVQMALFKSNPNRSEETSENE